MENSKIGTGREISHLCLCGFNGPHGHLRKPLILKGCSGTEPQMPTRWRLFKAALKMRPLAASSNVKNCSRTANVAAVHVKKAAPHGISVPGSDLVPLSSWN